MTITNLSKKIEYIELDETQYQRVQNIITDVDNNTEPSPPYTEIYPNINEENKNIKFDNFDNVSAKLTSLAIFQSLILIKTNLKLYIIFFTSFYHFVCFL